MNDQPPPLPSNAPSQVPTPPQQNTLSSQAATVSVVAPFVAIALSIFGQPQVRGHRWGMMILGLTSVLLIVLGLVCGVVGLIGAKRHGYHGILGKAIAGTCICGLLTALMLISIPGLIRAMER